MHKNNHNCRSGVGGLWVGCLMVLLQACGARTGAEVVDSSAPDTASQDGGTGDAFTLKFPDALPMRDRTLSIEPATVTLQITSREAPAPSAMFSAFSVTGGEKTAVAPLWSIDRYDAGNMTEAGVFSTKGLTGGKFVVTATYGGATVTATVTVNVVIAEIVAGMRTPSAAEQTKLRDAPTAEPANTSSKIRYPLADTVFPRGLTAPAIEISPGPNPPDAVLVRISGEGFSWEGTYAPSDKNAPALTIPQDIWDAALASNTRRSLKVEVIKLSGGTTYGPAQVTLGIAPTSLRGAVYYMTYTEPVGLYSVRPGVNAPPKHLVKGCVVCHSVSANGRWLSTGAEQGDQLSDAAGVYKVGPDGSATQTAKVPSGFGGDTRGLSFAAWMPDGSFVVRSKRDFWGGTDLRAFAVDPNSGSLREVTVEGFGSDTSGYVPSFSPDGKRIVFTTGDGNKNGMGTPRRSLAMMSVTPASDKLSFSDRKLILDNGDKGDIPKYAGFLPDSTTVIYQQGNGYDPGFGGMLPSVSGGIYSRAPTRLWAINTSNGQKVELKRANQGLHPTDEDRNYEPSALPVPAGGYYWIVFTSQREHGNAHSQDKKTTQKQLWVSAISPQWSAGEDPSHPPFFLPNQGTTHNERGYWALESCRAEGLSCESGDQCCEGFCRPADLNKPDSARVCQKPKEPMCAQETEKCATSADCCPNADRGDAICLGGFCTIPAPPG